MYKNVQGYTIKCILGTFRGVSKFSSLQVQAAPRKGGTKHDFSLNVRLASLVNNSLPIPLVNL